MKNSESTTKHLPSKDIYPNEAWELISKNKTGDDLTIIDVSTPQEYRALHLEGAINISLLSRFFKARLDAMEKSRTYIVYCKVGGRSKVAQKLMGQFGFQNVYNITGGTLLWEEEELPFATGTDGSSRFSFCPFFISIVAFKKIKKAWRGTVSRIAHFRSSAGPSGQES